MSILSPAAAPATCEQSPAQRDLVMRIKKKAAANGVLDLVRPRILEPLRIASLETAELHELRAVQTMLASMCLFASYAPMTQ